MAVSFAFFAAALVCGASANWQVVNKGLSSMDMVLKTTDGATTWNACNVSFGADELLLDADANQNTAVVGTIFGELYTNDAGNTWGHSVGGGSSQSVHAFANDNTGKKFGVTGTFGGKQGVAVSVNGGANFKRYPISALFTDARYGAFPSDTTWYVAAGQWGNDVAARAPRRKSVFQNEQGRFPHKYTAVAGNGTGYAAQIVKTSDGGKTWTTLFSQNNTFYFNGIDCDHTNVNHCCAVGESDVDNAGRVYCTWDGLTWTQTFFSPGSTKEAFSLMELRFVGSNEIWAVGGELTAFSPNAWFLHSSDGGKTWVNAQTPIPGSIAVSVDMVSTTIGYASLDNTVLQQGDIAKYTA